MLKLLLVLILAPFGITAWAQNHDASVLEGLDATLYKSPTCGCCTGYVEFLHTQGLQVEVINTDELNKIKVGYAVPLKTQSCHTVIIGNYIIEGHVPLGALVKLFTETPDVAGIGLPGMPIGTPGMDGPKTETYNVFSFGEEGLELFYSE